MATSSTAFPKLGRAWWQLSAIKPERNLALELVRVTEAAALAAAPWVGRGDKHNADDAAVRAMRFILGSIDIAGTIVIGEGEKDNAPWLYNGEKVGNGSGPEVDVAVDPIDGTSLTANGQLNAISVIAIADRGSLYSPESIFYMDKIVVGPEAKDQIDINAPVIHNLTKVAKAKSKRLSDITVMVLNRNRNQTLIDDIRNAGSRIRLIQDGDVAASVMAARPNTGVDMLMGIGGTPEGVIAACAMKTLGGTMQGRLAPQLPEEIKAVNEQGLDITKVLTIDELVRSDNAFFAATGITDGELLKGVRYQAEGATTDSIALRALSGTTRRVLGEHRPEKLVGLLGSI
ncbi:MAG: class II fructose-bisphosphatase [Actinobacteria bacterium]|nr:class II fructose-bisphosphatase [Actinomycetota bacterium]